MLATKVIKTLRKFVKDHGDLPVFTSECGSTSGSYCELEVHELRVEDGPGYDNMGIRSIRELKRILIR